MSAAVRTTIHVSLDVRGALRWPKRRLGKLLIDGNGRWLKAEDARTALLDFLAAGHEALPIGECSNFDKKTGCRGHQGES